MKLNEKVYFTFRNYIYKSRYDILIYSIFIFIISLFLYSKGNSLIVLFSYISISSICFFVYKFYKYRKRKIYLENIFKMTNSLDKKYLIAECIKNTDTLDDELYLEILKIAGRNMLEEVSQIKRERLEYKEYIEKWVHEIKTPISVLSLNFENNKKSFSREARNELLQVEGYVEQALFYARSETVEKDYFIKELNLEQCINNIIIKNKLLLISSSATVDIGDINYFVYSDEKWISFIISQILNNAVKYKRDELEIKISAIDKSDRLVLIIEDNGQGIEQSELGRVFDKGFTGGEKRGNKNSTGIGLYLVKKLIQKLGLLIKIESKVNRFTRVLITFPKGNFSNNSIFRDV